MHDRPRLTPAATLLAVVALAAGCGDDAPQAPPDGAGPACTGLVGRTPDQVLGAGRSTPPDAAAGIATWGDPAIVLRCGVRAAGPTSAPCLTVDGVDWLLVEDADPVRFVTYGTRPVLEVSVPGEYERTSAPAVLTDLGPAARSLPTTRRCT